ncbi:MAG: type II toxin-antitoxin system VapC family toxin [Bacteroidia bacterium]
MRYLLDTHSLIWFLAADKQLSSAAKKQIDNFPETNCFVSIATFWEIAIKIKLGKIKFTHSFAEMKNKVIKNDFEILPITFENTLIVSTLPLHHRDPFDRIIISQAMEEKLTIITHDKNFKLYKDIHLLW